MFDTAKVTYLSVPHKLFAYFFKCFFFNLFLIAKTL